MSSRRYLIKVPPPITIMPAPNVQRSAASALIVSVLHSCQCARPFPASRPSSVIITQPPVIRLAILIRINWVRSCIMHHRVESGYPRRCHQRCCATSRSSYSTTSTIVHSFLDHSFRFFDMYYLYMYIYC